jgi:hypothetical protein
MRALFEVDGIIFIIQIFSRKSPSSSSSKSERREQRSSNVSATVAAGVSGAFHSTMSSSDLLQHHHLMQNQEGQRHVFQENTYKKITPCDVCSQVLRGIHTQQMSRDNLV